MPLNHLQGTNPSGGGYPDVLPGVAVALLLALVLCGWVARRLGTSRVLAWLVLATIGVILAVTLTPRSFGLEHDAAGIVACDLSRIGPASIEVYLGFDDPTLNLLLFIPLGVLIGQMEHGQHRRSLVAGAVLLPVAIEILQALVVPLGRACQGGDVFDNLAGLLVGLAIGAAWRRARRTA